MKIDGYILSIPHVERIFNLMKTCTDFTLGGIKIINFSKNKNKYNSHDDDNTYK